ncbi:MAG: sulfotransferase [Gammaproteobacteria bacterium]|nr:sulfotransferase [Gammaproteobacteria bacterium]
MPTLPRAQRANPIQQAYEQVVVTMRSGDLPEAEQMCRRALISYPRDPNLMCLTGELCLRLRRPQEAITWFGRVLEMLPGYPRALEGKGKSLLAEKRPNKAVNVLRAAAEKLPDRVNTHLALGRALMMAGKRDEAATVMEHALALDPGRAAVTRASDALQEGRTQEAEKTLREYLQQNPDDPIALRLLSQIAMDKQRRRAAVRLLKRAVEVAPDFVLAWNNLAEVQMKEEQYEGALESVGRAIALDPRQPQAWSVKGNILSRAQRHEEALQAFDTALKFAEAHSGALSSKGHVLKTIGRTDEAIGCFRQCIRDHPQFGEPYWSLANLKTFSFDPDEVKVMEDLVQREELQDESRVNILYALGKHYENQHEYDRAFGHYQSGAGLRRQQEVYDPVQNQVVHDRNIEVFSGPFLAEREGQGNLDDAPILVVGLPRSGSTLIEQILASHSMIEGTMELPDLGRCIRAVSRARKDKVEYPEAARDLAGEDLRALGQRYLDTTQRYRSGKPYFIDKMPNNFSNLGFLHLILPNAKVINARRHPLDSCLGSYKQLFYNGQSYTYDFFELGQYYLQYQRIMDHWHEVMPGKILDVHYEDVVRDQEGQTRRMLEYIGAPFEDQCLRFWETERAINTASSEQVRKPIYTKGLNFWKHYEHHLGELIEILELLLKDLPEEDRPGSLQ